MAVVVQKFGGSSVADVEKIRAVAQRVKARRDAGDQPVVVVSAMGDTTDDLLKLAKQVSPDPPRRELDMLLTCGERISMALLSMALHELGVSAISFTGSQSGIITTDAHSQARIVEVKPTRIEEALSKNLVVIVAGYQGVSKNREVTTLGRGGSDTTAVALAAALQADCEIYSDVDGVFSADPRVVESARKLAELTYEQMQELAAAGAKVLNAQAVEFAREKGIVIHARLSHGTGTGTQVRAETNGNASAVTGVTSAADLIVLSLAGNDAGLSELLDFLESRKARARFVVFDSSAGQSWIVLPTDDLHGLSAFRKDLAEKFKTLVVRDDLGTVTAVGAGIGSQVPLVRRVVEACRPYAGGVAGVHTSALSISVLVEKRHLSEVCRRLHGELIG